MNKKTLVFISLLVVILLLLSGCTASRQPVSNNDGSVAGAKVAWNFDFFQRLKEKILSRFTFSRPSRPNLEQKKETPVVNQPDQEQKVDQRQDNTLSKYGSGDYNFTVEHQNKTRFYSVHIPQCYSEGQAIPVIINFHGGSSTAEKSEEGIGGMNRKADESCFIAVHPSGLSSVNQPGKQQYWNAGTLVQIKEIDPSIDDVGFISKMLDELEAKFSIDAKKVYATGISNGAWMAYRLACELSDRITAIAPISGGLILENCNPKRPIPIIHFHGIKDPGWPYYGGNSCWTDTYRPPIKDTIQRWINIDKCADKPQITYQKGEVACETYSCQLSSKITFCTIEGGGHTYPGGATFQQLIPKWDDDCALGQGRGVGKTTQDIRALDAMWEFFKDISL